MKLIKNKKASENEAASVCSLSRGAVRRALKASAASCRLGQHGRPKHLNQEEEA